MVMKRASGSECSEPEIVADNFTAQVYLSYRMAGDAAPTSCWTSNRRALDREDHRLESGAQAAMAQGRLNSLEDWAEASR
jgi:hypothetical protein